MEVAAKHDIGTWMVAGAITGRGSLIYSLVREISCKCESPFIYAIISLYYQHVYMLPRLIEFLCMEEGYAGKF